MDLQNYEYKQPKAIFGTQNAKTSKGEELGYKTYISYLSPEKQNVKGKNLCPNASKGCAAACLNTAGRGAFSNVQKARINKTEFFLRDREAYLELMFKELTKAYKKYGETLVVRLNGTSDIPWENIKVKEDKNIMELFPNVQFYDYSKTFKRILSFANGELPKNYHLTYSVDERAVTKINAITALSMGVNVAMVFSVKNESELPNEYMGYPVVNGDLHDLTFLWDKGSILGLKAKGKGRQDKTGFVIHDFVKPTA